MDFLPLVLILVLLALSCLALYLLSISENTRVKALSPFLKKPLRLVIHYSFKEINRITGEVSMEDKIVLANKFAKRIYKTLPLWIMSAVSEKTFVELVKQAFELIDTEAKEYLEQVEADFNQGDVPIVAKGAEREGNAIGLEKE